MKRRYLIGGAIAVIAVLLATTVRRCDPPPMTSFSYSAHERPRVFVSHHPLRAIPGQTVTIRLTPDLRSEDGAVARAVAGLRRLPSGARVEQTCTAQTDGTFTCSFTLAEDEAEFIYDGHLELANRHHVNARASYSFTATAALGSNRLIKLREPKIEISGLNDNYRVDTAWVRDPSRNSSTSTEFTEAQFAADVETAVYTGILSDPIYRWRDNQLGFYMYSDPGFTSSYYSGFDTRCGQNPWPSELTFRSPLANMETVGVLHRYSGNMLEGTVPATPPPTATTFRDCAGNAVKQPGLRTFSVTGGASETAPTAKHEFGHAAFGLGDEYPESHETRDVPPGPTPTDQSCCCATEGGIDVFPGPAPGTGSVNPGPTPGRTPRGVRVVQCVQQGGGIGGGVAGPMLETPTCTEPPTFPPGCGATPQAACPQLSGNCVRPEMWLSPSSSPSPSPTPEDRRPNTFTSKVECERGRLRALSHPGIEDRSRSLGECRELCGPSTSPCPCGQSEAWIVDTNPYLEPTALPIRPDSMAAVMAQRKGGTCAWCVETSLCVRWQRARGETVEATWSSCNAPPENAVELERAYVTFLQALYDWINRHIQF